MNENDIYTILQKDDNLREAIRRHEDKKPPMPSDLNERLMERLEEEAFAKPSSHHRRIWPWIAAACVASMMIVVIIAPKNKNTQELSQHITQVEKKSQGKQQIHAPQEEGTQVGSVIKTAACEEKSLTPPLHGRGETVRNKWGTTIHNTKATAPKQEPLITHEAPAAQAPQSDNYVAVTETPHQQPEQKPTVLTERDIPITRPENYRFTSGDLALMKEQAHRAYVKRVQLELEILKCNMEQMKQQ